MNYKDFPKYDARRLLLVLFALERLGKDATLHYISQEIKCDRAEVRRAIESAQRTFLVSISKHGSSYCLDSWGIINKAAALAALQNGKENSN